MLVVAGEGVGVAQADAEEGAELEGFAGEGQVLGAAGVGRQQGVEAQEGKFGAREQGGRLGEGGGFCGVELLDEGFEVFVGHGLCVGVVGGVGGGSQVVVEGEVGGWWFIGKVSWDMSCEGVVFEMGVAVSGEWWC